MDAWTDRQVREDVCYKVHGHSGLVCIHAEETLTRQEFMQTVQSMNIPLLHMLVDNLAGFPAALDMINCLLRPMPAISVLLHS